MALAPGTRLGPYEVSALIGVGGMGEVYAARDTNLKRSVALKVLPEAFASDAERLARFQREAEVLASLNHPNIAQIHGLEKTAGATALVMELVEGPTLADRIARGPVPLDEALPIATQIAEALEAAHEQGIVHRDLKPANIKVKDDGTVKVLDFGLAKALAPDAAVASGGLLNSPTITSPAMTQRGVILGTAAYMSPEQARGKTVDTRTDIWAFGCVLFEMLTGRRAFEDEDVSMTLSKVLRGEPDFALLPGNVPPRVAQTLRVCLRKDVRQRASDIRDVRLALDGAFETVVPAGTAESAAGARSTHRRWLSMTGTALGAALLTGLAGWSQWPTLPAPAIARLDFRLAHGQALRTGNSPVAISPDGRSVVYNTPDGLYIRTLGALDSRLIPGTNELLRAPFFSPDGLSVAYFASGSLKRVAASGGAPTVMAAVATDPLNSGSWGADGTILFSDAQGIHEVRAAGGAPTRVIPTRDREQVYGPQRLPDGDSVIFTVTTTENWDEAQVVAQSLSSGTRTVLVQGGKDARYLPTGHLMYASGGELFGVAFDAARLTLAGSAAQVESGLTPRPTIRSAHYAVADNGTLIYVTGGLAALRTLVWVDRNGREEPVNVPPRAYAYAQLSPDGARVALDIRDEQSDIWIWDLARETLQRLTVDPGLDRGPLWTPDGKHVVFSRAAGGAAEVYWQAADGSGMAEPLTKGSVRSIFATDFSPDGRVLLYLPTAFPYDIGMVHVGGSTPAAGMPLLATPADERGATVSPDGRWLAYDSNESGRFEIYVRPFPDIATGRWQVSTGGGNRPRWSRDGRELFYLDDQRGTVALMTVSVKSGASFAAGPPGMLFQGNYMLPNDGRMVYDVSVDGKRFLMIKAAEGQAPSERIIVVQHWFEELKRLAPKGK